MPQLFFYRNQIAEPAIFVARLRETVTRIGRADDADVVLPDAEVSRSHCLVLRKDDGWEVLDRSSNGTFVGAERVTRHQLSDGEVIRLGPFLALYRDNKADPQGPTEEAQPEPRHEAVVDSGSEGLTVSSAWLSVTSGPGEGQRFPLRGGKVSVGGFGSRVGLPDPSLVRDHVRLRLVQGRTILEPAQGAAFIGTERVRDLVPLMPGEEVQIGRTGFTVEWQMTTEVPLAERFGEMVGTSEAMRRVFGLLRRMAAHHAPVLLTGESGTGKELAAKALHEASPRNGRPLVAINCGSISPGLFESELFGHEKGSFTGAADRRDGAFHRAHGGTLFLDEIGELPEEAQAKLLRTLESGEVRRVGSDEVSFPDVRVIAATNRNLPEAVKERSFRADLYFRLNVLNVRLPPLRERPEDIPLLAETIGRRVNAGLSLTHDAMEALKNYPWPGNAREMRNVLTRSYVLYGPRIDAASLLFQENDLPPPQREHGRSAIEDAERQVVLDALKRAGGNRSAAARALGIARSSLLYKLQRWGY